MIKLNDKEIESITAKALSDNPHWQPDAWGLFDVVAKAQLKKMVRWILDNGYEDVDGAGDSTWVISLDKLETLLDEDQTLQKETGK